MTRRNKQKQSAFNNNRILIQVVVGVVFAAVLAIPLLIEFRARSAHGKSLERLEQALQENTGDQQLTLSRVELLVAGSPDRHSRNVNGQRWEVFEWSGVTDEFLIAVCVKSADTSITAIETWGKLPDATEDAAPTDDPKPQPSQIASAPPASNPTASNPTTRPNKSTESPASPKAASPSRKSNFELPSTQSQRPDPRIVQKVRSLAAQSESTADILAKRPSHQKPYAEQWRDLFLLAHRDAYKQYGTRNPAWDSIVDRFLTGYADYYVADSVATDLTQMLTRGNEIEAAGCRDPLVLSVQSQLAMKVGHRREALRLIRLVEADNKSSYPPRWQLSTQVRSLIILQNFHERSSAMLRQQIAIRAHASVVQTVADASLDDSGRRLHQLQINGIVSNFLSKNDLQQLVAELAGSPTGDEWLKRMTLADAHRRLAWLARGSGLARTVSRDGWNSFNAHMGRARALLLEAWDMKPMLPESSIALIEVTMAARGAAGESTQFWFQQAVKADREEQRAYHSYRTSLLPRWGGSHQRIIALGRHCLNSKQFDTKVPWNFHTSVVAAAADTRDPNSIIQSPQIFADYKRLFQGYMETEGPKRRSFRESQLAAIAIMTGHLDEASELLEKLGDAVDANAFADMGVSLVTAREIIKGKAAKTMRFSGHGGELNGIAALNGGLLVTASSDGTAKVWELETARELGNLTDHLHSLSTMAVAPGGEMVASGDIKGRVIVWNPELQREFHTLQIVPPVRAIAFSRDERLLATGGGDGHVRIWDLEDGRLAATLAARGRAVGSLSFSADGIWLSSTAVPNSSLTTKKGWNTDRETREVTVWNLQTLEYKRWPMFRSAASLAEFSNLGNTVAVAGWDSRWANSIIKLVDAKTGRTTSTITQDSGRLHQLLFSPDDRRLYAAADNGDVLVIDTEDEAIAATFKGHSSPVRSIALTPDAKTLVSGDMTGEIKQWEVGTKAVESQSVDSLIERQFTGLVNEGLDHGDQLLGTCENRGVTLWSSQGEYRDAISLGALAAGTRVTAFEMLPDSNLVAVALYGQDGRSEFRLINSHTQRETKKFKLPRNGWIAHIRFDPDRKSVALNEQGERISVWEFTGDTARQTGVFKLPAQRLSVFDITADGRYLVAGTSRGQLVKWSLSKSGSTPPEMEEILPPSELSDQGIVSLRAIPNSQLFIATSITTADLWDYQTKRLLSSFSGSVVSVSPDGRRIAAAGGSHMKNEARILEATTGKLIRRFRGGHPNAVMAVAWSPDSRYLFTAGVNGKVRQWDTNTGRATLP